MAIDLDDREPDADIESAPAQSAFSIRSAGSVLFAAAARSLPKFGLHIFLIILPLISKFERTLPLPNSISESVLHGEAKEAAPIGQSAPAN